jgi:hypothetical protein
VVYVVEFTALAALVATVGIALWRSRAALLVKVAWVLYLLLATTLGHFLGGDWAFLRALSELAVLSGCILLASGRVAATAYTAFTAGGWALMALEVLTRR